MKELSIEDKAKAYDEVISKLKGFMAQGVDPLITRADVQDFFPELKESKDEKIRKAILALVRQSSEVLDKQNQNNMITWLENQAEQKSIWHNEDEEPKRGSLILLIMQSGTPIVAKIIEPKHTFNHGERWAYIDDLLEKQGKKKSIDYTHTNVFTEKVAIWFNNNFIVHDEYGVISDSFDTKEEMFEDFKNYMKEE